MRFQLEIKGLEARLRLEALVTPKRQALTRYQALLAPLLHVAEMAFPQQLKTSIFRLLGYIGRQFKRQQPPLWWRWKEIVDMRFDDSIVCCRSDCSSSNDEVFSCSLLRHTHRAIFHHIRPNQRCHTFQHLQRQGGSEAKVVSAFAWHECGQGTEIVIT